MIPLSALHTARVALAALLITGALAACATPATTAPTNTQTGDATALVGRARAELDAGDTAAALEALNPALAADPTNPDALLLRATAFERSASHAGALTDLDALLALAPDNADAHILRGAILTGLGRSDDAAINFQTALRLRPNAGTILAMQAIAYAQSGNRLAAETDLSRALQLGLTEEQVAQVRQVIDDSAAPQP